MSGINNMMNLGKGALMAHQRRMATHQNNVANASTPGYRRERVNLETLGSYTGVPLQGVRAGHAQSVNAPLLDRVVPEKRGEYALHQQVRTAAEITESLLNEDGLSDKLGALFSSARALELDGRSSARREDFLARASSLTETIQSRHETVSFQRELGVQDARHKVDELNGVLGELEEIEAQVMLSPHAPELVDARDELVNRVADLTGARVVPSSSGRVSLVTGSGTALFEGGRAREVSMDSSPDGISFSIGNDRPLTKMSGELGGLQRADEEVFQASLTRLHDFTSALANEINTLHSQGVGLDDSTGAPLFTFDTLDPASTIEVNAAILDDPTKLAISQDTASLPGGAQIASLIADLETSSITASGATAHDMLREDATALGSVASSSLQRENTALAALSQAESMQASMSGVSLEEEMMALTQAQRSYEASVKLIQTADELMQTILSLK